MKHILTILSLLISSSLFSQVVVKVPQQDISGKVNYSDSLSKYVTPSQLGTKVDTSHHDITNVFAPLYSLNVNDSTHELHVRMSTDTTFSDASDTTLASSLAVKIFASKNGDVDTVGTISSLINYGKAAKIVFASDSLRGGMFTYITTTLRPDSGTIFNANGKGGGYWRRNYQGNTVNAMWFGAVGDGVTDCTNAIQWAIKSVDRNNGHYGGTVYVPAGTYLISSPITLGGYVSIHGDYWSSTLKLSNGANCNMFVNPTNAAINYFKIYDLALQGNVGNNTSGSAFSITYNGFSNSDIYFSNLLIANFKDNGIYIENGWQYHIENSILEFFGKYAVCLNPSQKESITSDASKNVRRVFIQNSSLLAADSGAIYANGAADRWILGLNISNNHLGTYNEHGPTVHIRGAKNFVVDNNRILGAPFSGDTTLDIVKIDSSARIGIISNNTINSSAEYYFDVVTPARYAVSIWDSSNNISLFGNSFYKPRLQNIYAAATTFKIDTINASGSGASGKVYSGFGLSNVNDSTLKVDTTVVLSKSDTLNQIRTPYYKKWVLFGDSFSASGNHYSARVDSILHLTGTVTQAVSGAMISNQSAKIDSILSATPTYFKNFNIASLLIGVNDWSGATYPLGTRDDAAGTASFAGYLKHIIESILTSNPNIQLYIMTPTEANTVSVPFHGVNAHGWSLKDLSNLDGLICADYGVQCIDLNSIADFNLQTIPILTDDNLHPNYYGSVIIGDIVAHAFTNHNNKGNVSNVTYKNGNYGLGVLAPAATLDIPGSTVNSSTNLNHYKSVANFYQASPSVTGTMKIMLPKGWSDNTMTIEIKGYGLLDANWYVIVSGKNLSGGSWNSYKAKIIGSAPFKSVRLSYDSVNAKNVILLGDITTTWAYPSCEVTDCFINQSILTGWGSGWAISIISSETNIAVSKTVTPTLSMYETPSGRYLFNTTTDDGVGQVQVLGKVTYTVDPSLSTSDSLVHTDKKYVDAQVALKNSGIGSVNFIPYWNGSYSLTPSPFYISGGMMFGNGNLDLLTHSIFTDAGIRAHTTFTGIFFDDSQQTIRFFANGGNRLKIYSDNTLRYYSHPSVSASPYVIPDITQVDSAVKYQPYIATAVSYSATTSDKTIEVTATGQTITLPTAVGISGREYVIKLTAAGSATVATTSSQTIDGATTYSLSAQYKYVTVQSNGANWVIIGNN
jgi:hypothetical protein